MTARRVLRHGTRTLAALVVLAVAAAITIGLWLSTSLPSWNGHATVSDLGSRAEIVRDRVGATHIRANSERDAYFALGYAHAQDRLWQMDTYRRIGAGRLAEVVGSPGLIADRFTRTLGLYRAAERQVERLPPPVRDALDAYAAGVNAYIDGHDGAWPPEFSLLAYRPDAWRPADSLVLGKLLALMLGGNWFDELRRAALLERLPAPDVAFLMSTDLDDGPVTLERQAQLPVDATRLIAAVPDLLAPRRASNAWAVDGRHTETGKPILASDPHLGLTAPGIWYLAAVRAPGLSMTGGTVPGMPVHLVGHNARIAWGLTTTYGDLTDLVVLDLAEGGTQYLGEDGAENFAVREERIAVRLGADVTLRVRETRYGPVISDILDSAAGHAGEDAIVVLQATALRDDDLTPAAMYALNRAGHWDDFRDALRAYGAPQQNIIYADTEGTIGFFAPGLVPLRRGGRGLTPARLPDAVWEGYVPFDSLPQQRGATDGVIFNANNRIVGADYPYFISADWEPPFRAQRLAETLRGDTMPRSVAGHAALQADTVSTMARTLLPVMTALLGTEANADLADRQARAALASWDFRMTRDGPAPLIFTAWYAELTARLFDDDLGAEGGRVDPRRVLEVLDGDMTRWCDDRATTEQERCADQVADAWRDALATLSARYGGAPDTWRWGAGHPARFTHPLVSFLPGVPRWIGTTIESSGGNYTLMRGGHGAADGRFVNGHGAGYRAVYDLDDLSRSVFMVAPGTSGNPYSRTFGVHAVDWRDGRTFTLPADHAAARRDARGIFTLVPVE